MSGAQGALAVALVAVAAGGGYVAGHSQPAAPAGLGGGTRFVPETVAARRIATLGAFVDQKTGCEYLVVVAPAGAAVTPLISAGGWYPQGCRESALWTGEGVAP